MLLLLADSCKRKRLADISEGLPSAKRKKKSDHKGLVIIVNPLCDTDNT